MDAPDDAPNLLHYNPETEEEKIAEPFVDLYQKARSHFCQEVLKSSTTESAWNAALRPKWSPADHNTVAYDDRLSKLISRSWDEVRPTVQNAAPYIETAPSLLDVHSGLAHTFDVREGQIMPEKIALFNLRLWVSQALHSLWDQRLTGEATALFAIQTATVQLKGMAPKPLLETHISASHDLSNKYSNSCADS
jgi:hypothetical protein